MVKIVSALECTDPGVARAPLLCLSGPDSLPSFMCLSFASSTLLLSFEINSVQNGRRQS